MAPKEERIAPDFMNNVKLNYLSSRVEINNYLSMNMLHIDCHVSIGTFLGHYPKSFIVVDVR